MKKPIKRDIKKDLENYLASSLHRLVQAYTDIRKTTKDRYIGSGILITIKNINQFNNEICK